MPLKHDVSNCETWLEDQGWKIEPVEGVLAPFYSEVENYPCRPDIVASKDGEVFLFWYAHKGAFPWSERLGEPVTGLDWTKYRLAQAYQYATRYKAGLIFKAEQGPYIAKQLDQLPAPKKWFKDGCLMQGKELELACYVCWRSSREVFKMCKSKKRKAIAIWRVKEFVQETMAIQPSLV